MHVTLIILYLYTSFQPEYFIKPLKNYSIIQKSAFLAVFNVAFLTVLASGSRNTSVILDHRQATPNTLRSRMMQATPSKTHPSPTINTQEALGKYVIP